MENKKEIRDFLLQLIALTESNICFLDGIRNIKYIPIKYVDELKIIQDVINNFDFVKNNQI